MIAAKIWIFFPDSVLKDVLGVFSVFPRKNK